MSFVKLKEKQKPARFTSTLKQTVTGNSPTFYYTPYIFMVRKNYSQKSLIQLRIKIKVIIKNSHWDAVGLLRLQPQKSLSNFDFISISSICRSTWPWRVHRSYYLLEIPNYQRSIGLFVPVWLNTTASIS